MDVVQLTDETGATYYDLASGDHLEARKASVKDFDKLPPKVQQGWIETWTEEVAGDAITGLEGVAAITAYLKENKRRTQRSDAARRELIVQTLSVSLEEAEKEVHVVGGSAKKLDLVAAMRETLGVSYQRLQDWCASIESPGVVKLIEKRAKDAAAETKNRGTAST
ncbi:hypothetical protein BFL35_14855 [Clavibacter michiganensis]|nr:hypothetical protein BFL35_14855 [Clavibacter michiganensis]